MKKIVICILILISLGLATFYLTMKGGGKEKPLETSQETPVVKTPVERLDSEPVTKEVADELSTEELDSTLNKIEAESYSQLVDLVHNFISEHQNSSEPKTKELLGSLKEELNDYAKLLEGLDKNNPEKSTPIIEKLEAKRDEILDIIDDISVIEH
ncbi:hypothetical protein [Bacteriovorax sp. Seq25_V]|uniref:hypothetical protein n=1 Tax=Bacteriovorax sp. Seq25_V TaxID=1201288 RepID=UPI00038A2B43|nr:hypothetical protein [Bacteriovorax sp. Seq25_V]EQC43750.1 hypothetical protein M900_1525 [Bacteriovorax sp. Seq25_V]